jgi:SAM-dependent methyltransferase
MSIHCNLCQSPLSEPVYLSKGKSSLTSLCEIVNGQTQVWSCQYCGHIMTQQLLDAKQYYAEDYKILLSHDDEDQIYEIQADRIVYRTQHQLATLMQKVQLKPNARILDYGCAKASMPKQLLALKPELQMYLFDVSEMYKSHWAQFLPAERCAVDLTPTQWAKSFDLITSYFALEHIDDPVASMRKIADLLSPEGVFYGIVPDTVGNIADFIVIDHVNHFTVASLHFALKQSGFVDIQIDTQAHRGALVFMARKSGATAPSDPDPLNAIRDAKAIADYWNALSDGLSRQADSSLPAAIYGSGFYGAFIAMTLGRPSSLRCFLDASPYQKGKTVLNLPVLAPQDLPKDVKVLYIGLNPVIAHNTVAQMAWLAERDLNIVFLEVDANA